MRGDGGEPRQGEGRSADERDQLPAPETPEEAGFRLYADTALVIVRWTPDARTAEPEYTDAIVGHFGVGGSVPFEAMRDSILRWLIEDGDHHGDRHYEVRRRSFDEGASGAEAVLVLTLLSGVAGGVAGKLTEEAFKAIKDRLSRRVDHLHQSDRHLADVDGLRYALARAIDARASDLKLVEHRGSAHRRAATFETPTGQVYGVRIGRAGIVVRRLHPGEY
jgi:hypothetical protein